MDVLEIFRHRNRRVMFYLFLRIQKSDVDQCVPVCARNEDAWKQGSKVCGAKKDTTF
jgi:hypothetical protein